jgi:3-oxoacyl-[acyl-carrier protein] reductase
MSGLEGKVALVTGSSRGIGAAIAHLFAQHGARVAVHGRDLAALSAVRADIERAGGQAIQVAADVTKFAEIESMRRQIEGQLGPIDILVALQALVDQHPIRRLGTPEDVARATRFLASDDADWLTGIVLDVAGGAVLV